MLFLERSLVVHLWFKKLSHFANPNTDYFIDSVDALAQEQPQVASHVCEAGIPIIDYVLKNEWNYE